MPPDDEQAASLVKVFFPLDADDWHGAAVERLWADPLGDGLFRLRSSPFLAFGVSAEDVVRCQLVDGCATFAAVVARGGHSTFRLWLARRDLTAPAFVHAWSPLERLGCSFEAGLVLAVDVPPAVDIHAACALLEAGAAAGAWDVEEGHRGHPTGA